MEQSFNLVCRTIPAEHRKIPVDQSQSGSTLGKHLCYFITVSNERIWPAVVEGLTSPVKIQFLTMDTRELVLLSDVQHVSLIVYFSQLWYMLQKVWYAFSFHQSAGTE